MVMLSLEHIQSTGIYQNESTQCYEAWEVDLETGEKKLLSTCSMCVPEQGYQWWTREVWSTFLISLPLPSEN